MQAAADPAIRSRHGRLSWAGWLLGFALGGFFDGILLHQVLQWHHLLSGLEGAPFADIRVQILADGLFHVLMYVLAAAGLFLLWRSRRALAEAGRGRLLLADALVGFGVWHVLDTFLSHWILGIHRIRMDVDNRLFWDLLWLAGFGLAFVAAGWWLGRGGPGGGRERPRRRYVAPAVLVVAVLLAAPVAALPPSGNSTVTVLFRPGTTLTQVLSAVAAVEGRTVWSDPSGQLWAIDIAPDRSARALYGHGALLVSRSLLPVGCFNWLTAGTG